MTKRKLTKRQKQVLDDLFSGELSQQEVLARHKVKPTLYNQWLSDENFAAAFDQCIDACYRQSRFIIATYAPLAAGRLVGLTNSEKDETARKACLDIIAQIASLSRAQSRDGLSPIANSDKPAPLSDKQYAISDQTASKLLAALAEEV